MPHMGRWSLLMVPLVVFPLLAWRFWPYPRDAVYSFYRERGKQQTLGDLQGYRREESQHFSLLYTDADKQNVSLILETAESVYQPVVDEVGFFPTGKVPLIVYANREELRHAFGWANNESAMGVYWSGTIRLLSPNVWIDEEDDRNKGAVFRKMNPIAHELTHYVLDYMTNGNYPRWFTEGLAQRVEHNVTGFLWIEPESTLRQNLYTLEDLEDRFDDLKNQPLAYRQSYLLVEHMANNYGEDRLPKLVEQLGRGISFSKAVERTLGTSMDQCFAGWQDWVQVHLSDLEPAS